MKLPFVVQSGLTDAQLERYRLHIDSAASGWHRRYTESIWRRHQHASNARLSGFVSPEDRKRRLVHFYDEYGLEGRSFVLRHPYLWLSLTLPAEHVAEYRDAVQAHLLTGSWRREGREGDYETHSRGDLALQMRSHRLHPEDERRGYLPPAGYGYLELSLGRRGHAPPEGWAERPWKVFFDVGLRTVLPRGRATPIEPERIAEHLPAQVELGCGPSIEAGIPHLSTLHRIYGVSRADYSFVFRAGDDALLDVIADPETKYREMTEIYRACLVAQSTPFYRVLSALWRRGDLVGPIITNNFDCQCADLGLPEMSLRRYDVGPYYPTIDYDRRARSLLVVGVHADRRLVQQRARERGLRVIFVDPERYVAPDGRAIDYPVESPQDEDLFVRMTAGEAFERLAAALPGLTTAGA